MMNLVIGIHVTICVVLIIIILIQRGRGGGFIESFAGLESMFGTKTSAFLSKATSVLAVLFFLTCLLLAFLSLKESKSLMRSVKPKSLVPAATNTTAATQTQNPQGASGQPAVNADQAAPANQTAK